MAQPNPPENPLLSGVFQPLLAEHDCPDLQIEGDWPADLAGTLYRIGPNPRFAPLGPYNPLQGEGMVHAFAMRDGRLSYRNRWVRTRRWRMEDAAGRALFATADPRLNDPSVAGVDDQGAANTHILAHAGRLLALEEGHAPIALAPDTLETLGPYDFAGQLPGAMTAHPKVDPETGEMVFFANFPGRRFDGALNLYAADAAGAIIWVQRVIGPYPALVHDFAVTRRFVVLVVSPLTLSLERLREGAPPIAWEPERGGFVGLIPRGGSADQAQWFAAPTCMVWHALNAFDEGDGVVLDLCRQDAAAFPTVDGRPPAEHALRQTLSRWTIRPGRAVEERRLSEVVCEYPRLDERWVGRPYRYGFLAAEGGPGTGDLAHRALARFDHVRGEMRLWRAPAGQAVSEPVFVARGPAEGEGYLLAVIYDEARHASHVAAFDAERLEDGPLAKAWLDHHVPAGFHGSFVPAPA